MEVRAIARDTGISAYKIRPIIDLVRGKGVDKALSILRFTQTPNARVVAKVVKSAAAMLLESRIGERFGAIVTGASEKGTWVRLLHPPIEGKLVRGFKGMDIGHRLRVELIHTDIDRGYIDFKRVE